MAFLFMKRKVENCHVRQEKYRFYFKKTTQTCSRNNLQGKLLKAMNISVSDFFKPLHLKNKPLEKDYAQIHPYIEFAKSLSQLTYQSIYLIDYYERGFAYVSDNPIFLCGKSSKQVLHDGYLFYLKNVPNEDLEMLLKINIAGFSFLSNIPKGDRLTYSISYDFHLIQRNKHLLLINHKLTPLLLDKDANIWIALCVVSLSSNDRSGNIQIKRKGESRVYQFDLTADKWQEQTIPKLSNQEREILILSGQGFTMEKIAKELFLSIDTIKFHKKNLFKKLSSRSISEAIAVATNLTLI
jgi:DNA-binding CsgD family transcriptional regulator